MVIICQWCSQPFEAKAAEVNRGDGRFCSVSCGAANTNSKRKKNLVKLICNLCNGFYFVKACRVEISKFCSKRCKDIARETTGEYVARRTAFATLLNECYHCQSVDDLVLHHVDGQHFNNDPKNWRIVCRSCHKSTEHRV